ncbi:MAG: hypothetical protein HC904_10535 [Blastochloris sp.]|nr:hypothetical protein [Blastochloris sp.]
MTRLMLRLFSRLGGILAGFLFFAVFLESTEAAEPLRLRVLEKPSDGIKKVYVSHSSSNQKPLAVVVLVDVYNRTERAVLQTAAKTALNQMVNDIQSHQLAFVHLEINEDGSLVSRMDKKKGAVGNLVMQQVRDLYEPDVPLCLYPANREAVPVVSEVLNQFPEQIRSWCFFNTLPQGNWNKNLTAPGIIACQNNLSNRTELEAAFKEGRNQGKSWTWIEFAPNNTSGFQSFLWKYFAESVKKPEGTWMVTETKTKATPAQLHPRSPDLNWLPSEALGTAWAALQTKHMVIAQAPAPAPKEPPPAQPSLFPEIILEGQWQGTKGVYITYSLPKEKPVAAVVQIHVYNRKTRSLRKPETQASFAQW